MADQIETEVLIIGCGIAGGVAALELADQGIPVTVITRSYNPHESNSYYAQGGIIYQGENDSAQLLIEDILRAGAGHCNPRSAALLAERGPALVRQILLDRVRVAFDQNGRGLSLAREGGHSLPRIIHAADATGKAITTALLEVLQQHPKVTLLNGYTAVDLITSGQPFPELVERGVWKGKWEERSSACLGAYLLDQTGERLISCLARATILATGGLGQLFLRTSNPPGARGDGIAMAYRAGAQLADLEFVQFHPTTFYHPQAQPFLVSEAVRGAGARLVNGNGEPFMQKYEPEWKDLAPRDIVARSIQRQMMAGDSPNIYLDLCSYISTGQILSHFPTIYSYCLGYGVDITQDLVPVVPAAHYSCGGVSVDEQGQTSLDRLYAIGEVACTGLHGANRLASTSLLEGLVWGYQAADHIHSHLNQPLKSRTTVVRPDQQAGLERPDSVQIDQTMNLIKSLMWEYVGLVRTTAGLEYARRELGRVWAEVEAFYQGCRPTDHLIGLRNLAQTALLITEAALKNPVSQGCHYRLSADEERDLFSWKLRLAEPVLTGYNRK